MNRDDMTTQQMIERAVIIRSQNANQVDRLQKMTGATLDFMVARLEFFIQQLHDLGLLTEGQVVTMSLEWEEHLSSELTRIEEDVNLQIANQRAEQAARKRGLVLPGGQPRG